MEEDKCKKCRRAGEKLFLKGEKCFSPKCPIIRKPYAPGKFGKGGKSGRRRPTRGLSEYGIQLRDKQKLKFGYGLRERQFTNYVDQANKSGGGDAKSYLLQILESRLDNVVFRLGLAESRAMARQMVSHGHIRVNAKKVTISSYRVKISDKVAIRPQSANRKIFKDIDIKLKNYNPPSWLSLDKEKKEGEIISKFK